VFIRFYIAICFFFGLLLLRISQNAHFLLHLLQSTPSYEIELDCIDYLCILEFLDEALEKFNGNGEVHEVLDKFLWELVGQCAFIGSNAAIKRLEFLLQLKDMVLVDDISA
jgi:hypothetical protein